MNEDLWAVWGSALTSDQGDADPGVQSGGDSFKKQKRRIIIAGFETGESRLPGAHFLGQLSLGHAFFQTLADDGLDDVKFGAEPIVLRLEFRIFEGFGQNFWYGTG